MNRRIFLLPGFGEDHRCYRNLTPLLRGDFELIHVDYRSVLRHLPWRDITPSMMGNQLISSYKIHPEDRLIGHSMGGYFSYIVSSIQENHVAMLGGFSDPGKIVRMTQNKVVNYTMAGSGLIKTPLMKYYISKRVNNKAYLKEMLDIQDNFQSFSNADMVKMLTLSYGEEEIPSPSNAPLRIHAKDDNVVRPPDEDYHPVKGGHFSLVFHPEEVYEHLRNWLNH